MNVQECYDILGVGPQSTAADIRKAYRMKAKEWHPDVNKTPGAHEQFILLREAYEYLVEIRSAKTTYVPEAEYTWTEARTEQARDRGRAYAKMNYSSFRKSNYSKTSDDLEIVADHVHLVFAFLFSLFLIYIMSESMEGLGFLLALVFSTIIMWLSFRNISGGFTPLGFLKAILRFAKRKTFWAIVIFILNIYAAFSFGDVTIVNGGFVFLAYALSALAGLSIALIMPRFRTHFYRRFLPLCFVPLMVSLFLMLNYWGSTNVVTEHYSIRRQMYYLKPSASGTVKDTVMIPFDDGRYESFGPFWSYDDKIPMNLLTYTFKDGLFGLRVMTSSEIRKVWFISEGVLYDLQSDESADE